MNDDATAPRRVRFLGVHDLATGRYQERLAELTERFDPVSATTSIVDIIELHNIQHYLENDLFPRAFTDAERVEMKARIPQIRSTVARFFTSIDDANCAVRVADIDYGYHADLLDLLGRNRAFDRCVPEVMLPALHRTGVRLGEMLACKKLVDAYDNEIRQELLGDPRNAEHLVRKYLQKDTSGTVHVPASVAPVDAHQLLEAYVDSPGANPNYVGLIETAQINPAIGIDAKLKLRAKRRMTEMNQKFFEENAGLKTGCEVGISDTQDEPIRYEMDDSDGMIARFTYGRRWLDQTCDNPSILNNFQHLFEFADGQSLLTLPSYPAQLGVFERFMGTTGKTDYKVGAAFRAIDMSTLLQTRLYHHYLKTKNIDLEGVISWFFGAYLVDEFGALNFSFTPSDSGSSYLQKARHLFAEMESVTMQFSLFVENGDLDRDLLAITSDPVRYRELPSLVAGKYIYQSGGDEIAGILHALFSDQSTLTYIDETLKADDAASLLVNNQVAYADFHDYQKPAIDRLIGLGVLLDTGTRVRLANAEQFRILKSLFATQAASYYHLSDAGRAQADAMVASGWAVRSASLLTEAEAKYFNYFLNKVDFSNGPELRNKYLHGSQANADGEDRHFHTYITALRLIMALVIKMNDDFCIAATQKGSGTPTSA